MELFHTIVLSIAVIILILILTVVGIMLGNKKYDNSVFPPIKNSCPDYWSVESTDASSGLSVCRVNSKNEGTDPNKWKKDSKTYGYFDETVNFSNSKWTSDGGTALCNMKDWANTYNISWDGVSNFNGCK
jgi:hypothetical protein